jgi:hypothetical protein
MAATTRKNRDRRTQKQNGKKKIPAYFFSFLRLFICYGRRTYKLRDPALAKMQQCCWGMTVEKQS